MRDDSIPDVVTVEFRSEGRGEETPISIHLGGDRFEIVEVIDRAIITSVEAGEPIRRRYWVEIEDGRRCELTRTEPDGDWRINVRTF